MAMTELALIWLGSLATLTSVSMFFEFGDHWTRVALIFLAGILWGFFGMSSFDVIVRDTTAASASEPIMAFVYLGIGLAGIVTMYGFYELLRGFKQTSSDADLSETLR